MKFRSLCILILSFFLSTQLVSAQEVAEVQQTLITKRTATWCPFCGGWGWDFFEDLRDANSSKAVLVAAHFGGSKLENSTSIALVNNFGGAGQPKFYVNNDQVSVSSSSQPTGLAAVQTAVNDHYQSAPLANVGLETSLNGNDLDIKTKTRFFQDGDGAFYLGIYLVEDDVLETQAGQSGTVTHPRIIRGAVTSTAFGDLLTDGAVASGSEFTNTHTASVGEYNLENLDIVGVIWKEDNGKYLVVNVWAIDAKPTVSSSSALDPMDGVQASLHPTILGSQQGTITLVLDAPQEISAIVINQQGQPLGTLYQGVLSTGTHELPLDGIQLRSAGWYSVLIRTQNGVVGALPFLKM